MLLLLQVALTGLDNSLISSKKQKLASLANVCNILLVCSPKPVWPKSNNGA